MKQNFKSNFRAMNKIISFLILIIISFGVKGQSPSFTPIHNYQAPDGLALVKFFGIPYGPDTTLNGIPSTINLTGGGTMTPAGLFFQTSNNTLYIHFNGVWYGVGGGGGGVRDTIKVVGNLLYVTFDSTGHQVLGTNHIDGLVSGGTVTLDSCLTIDVTAATFYKNFKLVLTAQILGLAITTPDGTNPRIDFVVADTLGNVSVIAGTPSPTPTGPAFNSGSQIVLASIYVPQAASCLSIMQEIIYDGISDNSGQWDIDTLGVVADFINMDKVFHLNQDLFISKYIDGGTITFTKPGSAYDTVKAGEIIKTPLFINGALGNQIYMEFLKDGIAMTSPLLLNSYFSLLDSTEYQIPSVPLSSFTWTGENVFNGVRYTFHGYDTTGAKGLYFDWSQLQIGFSPQIKQYVDSIKVISSNVYYYINGIAYLGGPVGGGGGSETWEGTLINQGSTPFAGSYTVDHGGNDFTHDNIGNFSINANDVGSFNFKAGITDSYSKINADSSQLTISHNDDNGKTFFEFDQNGAALHGDLPIYIGLKSDLTGGSPVHIFADSLTDTPQNVLWEDNDGVVHKGAYGATVPTWQQVLNSGSDINTQSNSINIGDGSFFFDMHNNLGHAQFVLSPNTEYFIGDGGPDYGMGYLDIIQGGPARTILSPGNGEIQIFATPHTGSPDSVYGVGSDRLTHLYPFSGGGGSTPPNIGSGFRVYAPQTPGFKTLFCVGCTLDSATNTNALTITVSGLTRQIITSGSSGTVTGGNYIVTIDPASTLAAYTLTMPASPTDLQIVEVDFGGTLTSGVIVTALIVSANSGQTILDNTPPGSATADNSLFYRYRASNTTWYRFKLFILFCFRVNRNRRKKKKTNMKKLFLLLLLFYNVNSFAQTDNNQPKVFNVLNWGVKPDGTTDNTVAFQNCINACVAAGGGTIYVPYSVNSIMIKGSLQTSVSGTNPNSQLYIPDVPLATKLVSIKFLGGSPPPFSSEAFTGIARTPQGPVIESTIQGTGLLPSVFSTPWETYTGIGYRNYVHIDMENLIIRTSTKIAGRDTVGTMCGVNWSKLLSCTFKNVKVDVSSRLVDMQPPTNETYGVIFPSLNNHAILITEGILFVEGYKYGVVTGEHMSGGDINVLGCANGIVIDSAYHSIDIKHLIAENCINNIYMRGNANVYITSYNSENSTTGWWTNVYDVKFAVPPAASGIPSLPSNLAFISNRSVHIAAYAQVTPNVGVQNLFTTNDSTSVFLDQVNNTSLVETIQYPSSAATQNINLLNGNKAYITLTANTTVNLTNSFFGKDLKLFIKQDGTGNRSLTVQSTAISVRIAANAVTTVSGVNTTNGWVFSTDTTGTGGAAWLASGNQPNAATDFLGSTTNVSLRFRTNNTQVAILDSNGRFGIGTNAPVYDLHVKKSVGSNGAVVSATENTNSAGEAANLVKTSTGTLGFELLGATMSGGQTNKALISTTSAITDFSIATFGSNPIIIRPNTTTGADGEIARFDVTGLNMTGSIIFNTDGTKDIGNTSTNRPRNIFSSNNITAAQAITATSGNIVATAGNINATAGSMTAGTTITSGTNIIAGTNIGLGNSAVNSWASGNAIQKGANDLFFGNGTDIHFNSNAYFDGAWKYSTTAAAVSILMNTGDITIRSAASGTANTALTWIERWYFKNAGNLITNADNSYDIGASGANRPRTLYLGTDANIAGNLNLGTAGSKITITEGSNGRTGQTTLVLGTKAITITGLTTSSRAFIQGVSQGGTVSTTFEYAAVCTSNTLTITALTTGNVTNTLDTSTLNYFILN